MKDFSDREALAFYVSSSTVHTEFDGQMHSEIPVLYSAASGLVTCEMYAHVDFFFVVTVDNRALGDLLLQAKPSQWFHVKGKITGFRTSKTEPWIFATKVYATALTPLSEDPSQDRF